MSDFGDDMEVDEDAPQNVIQFSSENTAAKGKRIVADLPIAAEDNLPWYVLRGSSGTMLTQT
jgi:replication factor C subunit 3/5